MYPAKFKDLSVLKKYLLDSIAYDENDGFTFSGIKIGTSFEEIQAILGEPEIMNIESDQQQTLEYNALINHPSEGPREHHNLNLLFWAFNRKPFKIMKLHFNYFNNGIYAGVLKEFMDEFLTSIINKFGKPKKKSFRIGKEEVLYEKNGHKLSIWRNAEGIRITLK